MKIRISMTIDETETIDLLTMERGELQAGNLGFSLAEAKSFLANGQKTLVDVQAAMHAQARQCEICETPLRRKGGGTIVAQATRLLGIVVIGGLASSFLLTLLLVPVVYAAMNTARD